MSDRIAAFRAKVESKPNDTLARYVLAKEYFDLQRHEEGAAEFAELVRHKPDWMKAWIHLGQSLLALGRKDEARAALDQALALARAQHHEGPEGEIRELLATL